MTDLEIAEFWEEHDAADFWPALKEAKVAFVDKRPKKAISLRFDVQTLEELKRLATGKGIGYQTLIRMWVKERLNQEAG